MRPDPVLQLLGLAQKAGSVASGEFLTETKIKEGRAHLCMVAGDASDNTRKKFSDMCKSHKVPYVAYSDMETIGHAIGKQFRASLCVTDAGLAEQILNKSVLNGGITEWQK
ncbi:MAG: ribosomal L7Ae/L30e/S12e/Gadd45 family protein [Lachnospiraceae bacterium]|nr:ribosomal L7Ae/L30e/S12e/Gadd45 family protein [Lachnospiraceae bacterium]